MSVTREQINRAVAIEVKAHFRAVLAKRMSPTPQDKARIYKRVLKRLNVKG